MSQQKILFEEVLGKQEIKKGFINKINGNIPPHIAIPRNSDLLVIGNDQNALTHGLHKYPAKYIPEFPRWAIQKYTNEGDTVIDPFAGSGTTNVESKILNRNSYAIDVDPLAILLTKVKTTPVEPEKLKYETKNLIDKINSKKNPSYIPDFKNRDHWFKPIVSKRLAIIKECVIETQNKDIKDLFTVTFSSIIRKVSNADMGSHKPCIRKGIKRNIPDPIRIFKEKLSKNVKQVIKFSKIVNNNSNKVEIIGKDAKSIDLSENSIDLALTSPPYINALDYPRTHKLEYYWLGYYNDSLVDLKKKFIGTEKVYAHDYNSLHSLGNKELDSIIEKLFEIDKKRSYIVYKFYSDIIKNLKEINRVLKEGGKYIIFIGNNRIREIEIENYKFIKEESKKIGFNIQNYFKSRVINHYIPFDRAEKIDKDYVLVLEK